MATDPALGVHPDSSVSELAAQAWRPASLRLDLQLGEIKVASISLPAYRRVEGSPLRGAPETPPRELLRGKIRAGVIDSAPVEQPLSRVALEAGLIRYVPRQYRRYFLDLGEGTFEDYLQGFSAKTRATLRRKLRKCSEAHGGDLACAEYRTREEVSEFLDRARALSSRTYQERLLGRGLPGTEGFRDEVLRLADEGNVRAYLLMLGGRPAAYLLCPVREGRVLYQHLGYDPDFAELSPGTVLQFLAFEKLFAERLPRVFDFTEGEGEHKEFWARGHVLCADVYYFRPSPRSVALVGAHLACSTISRTSAWLLARLGLKAWLKRAIRVRA